MIELIIYHNKIYIIFFSYCDQSNYHNKQYH